MKHEEMKWQSNDGLGLFAQNWEPDGEIRGVVCLVHGLGEHSGRYRHWAEKLTAAGYGLISFDLRGHGRSEGQLGHAPTFDHFADDVSILINEAKSLYAGKPLFIYGHSLGGIIVLYYLVQRQPELKGAVVTNPGLHTAIEEQKVKVFLAYLLGSLAPKGGMPSGLEVEALSRDNAVIEAYRNDALVHDKITFGFSKSALKAIQYIYKNATRIKAPLLMLHGTDDRIAYVSGSEKLAELLDGDYTIKLWEGLYHELHNEPEKDEVFAFIREWLDSKVS